MATNKRDLKAYVRFDGTGRIVPGSLILRRKKPKVGKWQEILAHECCNTIIPPVVGCSTFFINQVTNPASPGTLYASAGAAIDVNCNTFLPMVDYWENPNNPNASISLQNNVLQKYDENGDLLWEKGYDYVNLPEPYTSVEVQTVTLVDNNKDLIVPNYIYTGGNGNFTGITKFDNNGVELWSILMETDPLVYTDFQQQYVYDLKVDSSNNIYVLLSIIIDGILSLNLRKISPLGVMLQSKSIEGSNNIYQGFININSNGDVYLVFNQTGGFFDDPIIPNIIKLDSSFNEIWNKTIDDASNQSYLYGVQFDPQENIVFNVGNGAGSFSTSNERDGSYVKLSPTGSVIWTTKLTNTIDPTYVLGTYQLDTDSSGNVYSSSTYPNTPIPGYTDLGSNPLIISKLSNDGTYQWAYIIDSAEGLASWYNYSPISGKIVNNALVLGYYGGDDPFQAQLLKLPLTQLTPGTYGPYVVTDITSLWSATSPVITLSDDTSVIYNDVTITVTNLDYIEFENPTTITKTLL